MKVFRLVTSQHVFPLLIVFFFGVLASRTLLFQDGYFNMHDDLQMMRQLQMEKCFADGQIPCRWVPDMGYGYGFPLFNFYPPLPYLIGQLYRLIGFSFVDTAKILFATAIILSGVFMYVFTKEFLGKLGGIVASVFYIWAPYHAVDVYVRGAMNESWALVFFPLIMWAGYKVITNNHLQNNDSKDKIHDVILHDGKWIVLLALSYFGLFTSHNLMLMIFTPVFAIYSFILIWQHKAWVKIPSLIIAGIWSLGLSAFFTIPAISENHYTQLASQLIGYYDYTGHFVTIQQLLFSTFWGYGPSVWLEEDGMSFQIGYPLWILSLVTAVLLLVRLLHYKAQASGIKMLVSKLKNDKFIIIATLMLLVGWGSAFLTHSKSTPIWQAIPQLGYLQFSWRLLTLVIFGFSFAVGVIPGLIDDWKNNKKWYARFAATIPQLILSVVLVLSIVVYSWFYFLPEGGKMGALTDQDKFTGAAWDLQQTAGIYDYLPVTAKRAPNSPQTVLAEIIDGEGSISGAQQGSYYGLFSANIQSDTALVRINIFDFPGWYVTSNEVTVDHFIPENEDWGRIHIQLTKGDHRVYTQLLNTPVRTLSNTVSLASWILLILSSVLLVNKQTNSKSRA